MKTIAKPRSESNRERSQAAAEKLLHTPDLETFEDNAAKPKRVKLVKYKDFLIVPPELGVDLDAAVKEMRAEREKSLERLLG